MSENPKICPVIVVGMHRSGTSACALALHELGLFLGPEADIKPGDQFNEDGYFENKTIMQIGFGILAEFENGESATHALPKDWLDRAEFAPHVENTTTFLAKYFEGQTFFGWKDPRTALLLPIYKEVFRRLGWKARYVVPIRHPLSVAASLSRRDKMPQNIALGLWLHYVLTSLHDLRDEDVFLVPYEEFINAPREVLEPFFGQIGVDPGEDRWQRVSEAIRSDRSHSAYTESDLATIRPEFIFRVFSTLSQAANDRPGFQAGAYRDRIRALYEEWQLMGEIRNGNWQQGRFDFLWKSKVGESISTSCAYGANNDWAIGKVLIANHAADLLLLRSESCPVMIQLRNCAFVSPSGERISVPVGTGSVTYHRPMPDGSARILAFGEADHATFEIPQIEGDLEFEFEYRVEISYRVARAAAVALGNEVAALRQQVRGGFPTPRVGIGR